jgi:hypothetical protein
MQSKHSIVVETINKIITFVDVEAFEIMPAGHLYIREISETTLKTKEGLPLRDKGALGIVENRYQRTWIPLSQIKEICVTTSTVIDNPTEIKKYQMFKKHGIDITTTAVSHTTPPTVEEIEKEIAEEEAKA